jgi:spectrin beta
MERDLAAIKAKLASLESEASKIEGTHPEEAEVVIERITKLSQSWEQLTAMLTVRDAKLEEAGDLHRFLKDLDHFQVWLKISKTADSLLAEKLKIMILLNRQ